MLVIGISDKFGMKPFDIATNTGKIVKQIEDKCESSFYKTNLVSFTPLDSTGKMRYPTAEEITNNLPALIKQINDLKPNKIILFGKIVQNTFKNVQFDFNTEVISTYHPSYIWIYQKKHLDEFINNLAEILINNNK